MTEERFCSEHPNSVVTWRADAKAAALEAENAQLRAACWAARCYIVQAVGQLDRAGHDVVAQCDAAVGHEVPGQ